MSSEPAQLVQLEVLPPLSADEGEEKGRPPHRPRFLDARRFVRICKWIEAGESASEACRRELVTYRNFRIRVTQSPVYERRLKKAEQIRESLLKEYHMANVKQHAPRNLLASLWWLERRYPGEFSLRPVQRDAQDVEQLPVCEKISLAQLTENARLMAETLASPPPGLLLHEPASPGSEEAVS
jgi:hypothetical protein